MNFFENVMNNIFARKIFVLAILAGIIYLAKDLITMFLLTFLFTYLFNSTQEYLHNTITKYYPVRRFTIILVLYLLFIAMILLLVIFVYFYLPDIIKQSKEIIINVAGFLIFFDKNIPSDNALLESIKLLFKNIDFASYVKNGSVYLLTAVTDFGVLSFNVFMAFILSMFYMLQKDKVAAFMRNFKESRLSWFYEEVKFFGQKFTNSFGKVIQAQIMISFINSILSILILWLMNFPNLLGLGAMIFVLGLIPVAGVVISLIPLSIIAFNIGGFRYIVYVLILIAVLHSLESYILNPKLMSDKTKLPIFCTFLILIVSEHFLGVWGLIVGLPITMFLLDILEVNTN